MKRDFMFTSESVTQGHPDKLCDQISDAIVDHLLARDPHARVRAECAVSSAIVFIAAHFATSAKLDIPHVARKVIKRIGYDQPDFNAKTCSILTAPQGMPPDKSYGFEESELSEEGIENIPVRHQVTVFGFACNQTPVLMPLPLWLARRISSRLTVLRSEKTLPYLMPDGKVQVGIEYRNRRPHRVHSVTITASQRHSSHPSRKTLHEDLVETAVQPVFRDEEVRPDRRTRIFINPDGPFLGGPSYHSGLTGRKNAVDTYGLYARNSANALSGKDPCRIDRSGAYIARYVAKNVVAADLASECEVTLSYSTGLTRPVSLLIQTFDTGKIPDADITERVQRHFDFRLAAILRQFNLRHLPALNPVGFYEKLAAQGHFGRADMDLPWERTDKAEELSSS
jgi:S-adenosylmethionine synthetase